MTTPTLKQLRLTFLWVKLAVFLFLWYIFFYSFLNTSFCALPNVYWACEPLASWSRHCVNPCLLSKDKLCTLHCIKIKIMETFTVTFSARWRINVTKCYKPKETRSSLKNKTFLYVCNFVYNLVKLTFVLARWSMNKASRIDTARNTFCGGFVFASYNSAFISS